MAKSVPRVKYKNKKIKNNNLKKKRKSAAQNSGSESARRVYICCIINWLFCNRPTDFAETQGPLEAYSPADEIMKWQRITYFPKFKRSLDWFVVS